MEDFEIQDGGGIFTKVAWARGRIDSSKMAIQSALESPYYQEIVSCIINGDKNEIKIKKILKLLVNLNFGLKNSKKIIMQYNTNAPLVSQINVTIIKHKNTFLEFFKLKFSNKYIPSIIYGREFLVFKS